MLEVITNQLLYAYLHKIWNKKKLTTSVIWHTDWKDLFICSKFCCQRNSENNPRSQVGALIYVLISQCSLVEHYDLIIFFKKLYAFSWSM
jgi:hypothetical protein